NPVTPNAVAIPIKINVLLENLPPTNDSANTSKTVSNPPTKLMRGKVYKWFTPLLPATKAINNTTPNPLPAFTPIIPGSDNGFFETTCKMSPDNASAAPQTSVMMSLGILNL